MPISSPRSPSVIQRSPRLPGRPATRFPGLSVRQGPAGLVVVVPVLLALVAGCTRAPQQNPGPSASVTGSPSTSAAASGATTAATSAASTATAPASSRTATPTATAPTAASTSPIPAGPPACTAAALSVTVQRGSGAAGQQFASIQFANTSAVRCSLTGFPGVVLLEAGKPLGQPATRSSKPTIRVDLAAGGRATAQLTSVSTCNADNSDSVQVIPPNLTKTFVLPLRFRGCNALRVDPVAAA